MTSLENVRIKGIILRVLGAVKAGTSRLGDDGVISTLELSEVIGWIEDGKPQKERATYTYDLLKVLRENGLVKQVRYTAKADGDRSSRWKITAEGVRELRGM